MFDNEDDDDTEDDMDDSILTTPSIPLVTTPAEPVSQVKVPSVTTNNEAHSNNSLPPGLNFDREIIHTYDNMYSMI